MDGFINFMHRKDPSSNPALRSDLSMVSASTTRADLRQASKTKVDNARDDRATNIHVIEDMYYSSVGGPPTVGVLAEFSLRGLLGLGGLRTKSITM